MVVVSGCDQAGEQGGQDSEYIHVPPEVTSVAEGHGVDKAVSRGAVEHCVEGGVSVPLPRRHLTASCQPGEWSPPRRRFTYSSVIRLEGCDARRELGIESRNHRLLSGLRRSGFCEHLTRESE